MRTLTLLALGISGPALAAEPVLVPDFTPTAISDFTVAFMLQEAVIARLEQDGLFVVAGEPLRARAGGALDACADVVTCPSSVLPDLPARVAVVVRVGAGEGGLAADLALYTESDPTPAVTRSFVIPGGGESRFAGDVSTAVLELVDLLGDTPEALEDRARRLMASSEPDPTPPPPDVTGPPPPDPTEVPRPVLRDPPPPTPRPIDGSLEAMLEGSTLLPRHVRGSERHFRRSDLDGDAWRFRASPHAGRTIIEARGGIGIGDVDRHADVRVDLTRDLTPTSAWFQEGPLSAQRVRGGVFIGYAPVTWLDFGALVGMQYGNKGLTTGWSIDGVPDDTNSDDVVQAVQFYLQPRLRAYLASVGPVKPFLFGGAEVRIFDKYQIVDPPTVDYPEPPGGYVPSPLGGAGLLIDPGPIVGFFVEGSFAYHLGARAVAAEPPDAVRPPGAPSAPVGDGYTIGVVGGVQFRI